MDKIIMLTISVAPQWISPKKKKKQYWPQNLSWLLLQWKRAKGYIMVLYFHDHKHVSMRYALGSNNTVERALNIFTPLLYVSTWSLFAYFHYIILHNSPYTHIHTYKYTYIIYTYIFLISCQLHVMSCWRLLLITLKYIY